MQEGSRATDSTWREREGAEKELTAWRCGLPFKPAEKEMGREVLVGVSMWRMEKEGEKGGPGTVVDSAGLSAVGGAVAARIGEGGRRGRRGRRGAGS
jgi:hypothetical protein